MESVNVGRRAWGSVRRGCKDVCGEGRIIAWAWPREHRMGRDEWRWH